MPQAADAPPLFALFASLRGRDVLVVGGGDVAARKCRALLDAGARVTVGAPRLGAELAAWAADETIRHRRGTFDAAWLDRMWLVVAATDDARVNADVAAAAEERRIFANVVDDAGLSSFQAPAVVRRGRVQVAISTGGAAPMLARWLRSRIERLLDPAIGALAALLDDLRNTIRTRVHSMAARRAFYARVVDGDALALLRSGRRAHAEAAVLRELGNGGRRDGSVVLVGAGPGDPGLLTLHALRALGEADVILHDRLVGAGVLELARRDAQRIDVGKRAGQHRIGQDDIHALLLEHARAGKRVVRLKGGDPFVFGRGGEELEFLRAHGIRYEIVPGVTAALACAAYAGVPLTHRAHAQSVQFLTAHRRDSLGAIDAASLAHPQQTLAIYMGVGELASVRERLLGAGRSAATPVALIENGTRAEQRVVTGTLGGLVDLAARHAVASPALLIVGAVAALATRLAWFGAEPIADGGMGLGSKAASRAA